MAEFTGVLHVHSTYSDGALSLAEIVEWARGEALDFVCVTDHSGRARGKRLEELCEECDRLSGDVLLLPGVEFEHRGRHVLTIAPVDCLLTLTDEVAVEEPEAVREGGGLTIWAHPSLTFDLSLRAGIDAPYDGWEVWNLRMDGRMPCLPVAALRERVARQRPLMAFAGLDLHKLPIAMMPTCTVEVDGPTLNTGALIHALRSGNHIITVRGRPFELPTRTSARLASYVRHWAIRTRCVASVARHRLLAGATSRGPADVTEDAT